MLGKIAVRQHDGLYSLNDLHHAAGRESKHKPSEWLRNSQTQELVQEIGKAGIPALAVQRGGTAPGTYACRELVIAYAAWISPAFHLKVLRTFLAATTPQQPAALPAPAGEELLTLEYEGNRLRILRLDGMPWLVAADVALALGLRNSYVILRRLTPAQQQKRPVGRQQLNVIKMSGVRQAMLMAEPERASKFGKWLDQALEFHQAPATPDTQPDPGSLLRGMLAGNRFMCLLDGAGRITLREIPEDHLIIPTTQIPNWIADPAGARPELLPKVLHAVSQRMGG